MQKRLLIAVDGSVHAEHALLYAARLLQRYDDHHCLLFHARPIIRRSFLNAAKSNPKVNEALQRLIDINAAKSHAILEQSKQLLIKQGIAEKSIDTLSQSRMVGLAKDIIELAHKEKYDAIVAGRQGLARFQELFMGTTSAKLMEYSGDIPVWIVHGDILPQRFLIAVDLDSTADHIINYMCRMCQNRDDVHLTFLHVVDDFKLVDVQPPIPGAAEIDTILVKHRDDIIGQFWSDATRQLAEAGLKESQLEIKTPRKDAKIGRMIIAETEQAEAAQNPYDTVVLGRSGSDKIFYFGNVARYVSERLEELALWMIG
jgi:nucleotide-binding universal stress UspA family protein